MCWVGCGFNDVGVVDLLMQGGLVVIEQLLVWGIDFDCIEDGVLNFGCEVGYQFYCILYVGGDVIGCEIVCVMSEVVCG